MSEEDQKLCNKQILVPSPQEASLERFWKEGEDMKQEILHFLNHIKSGKRLDVGNAKKCDRCDSFGYPRSSQHDFVGKDISIIARYYVDFDGLMNTCERCKGDGKEPI